MPVRELVGNKKNIGSGWPDRKDAMEGNREKERGDEQEVQIPGPLLLALLASSSSITLKVETEFVAS